MVKKQTIFGEAKYKYLANIISFKDPKEAVKSVEKLKKEFNGSKTMAKRLRIARATSLASNRSLASSKRKNLSSKEKKEFNEISNIYGNASRYMYEDFSKRK